MSGPGAVTDIRMPQWGMAMKEGAVNKWLKAVGDRVEVDDPLVEVESAKTVAEIASPVAGTLVEILVDEGQVVDVRTLLARVSDGVDASPPMSDRALGSDTRVVPAARRRARELSVDLASVTPTGAGGRLTVADVERAAAVQSEPEPGRARPPATPVARKLASELGIELATIAGTGAGGRVTKEDVHAAASAAAVEPAAEQAAPTPDEDGPLQVPMHGIRRVVAQRMMSSLQQSAQLTLGRRVWVDEAMELRARLVRSWADDAARPSYTDLVVAAAARALVDHPYLNSVLEGTVDDGTIVASRRVHIGLAVATDDGLLVPVVRDADRLGVRELARRTSRLAVAARDRTLGMDELTGSTFTVSSLGGVGVEWFTPILNPPEVAILGVGAISEAWRRGPDGQPVAAHQMALSLTVDHRIVDGHPAGEFLATIAELIEDPHRLLG